MQSLCGTFSFPGEAERKVLRRDHAHLLKASGFAVCVLGLVLFAFGLAGCGAGEPTGYKRLSHPRSTNVFRQGGGSSLTM